MEYLKRFFQWFASGFGVALGVACVMVLYSHFGEKRRSGEFTSWLPSSTVEVSEVERLALAKELTVAATIRNNAASDVKVRLELTLVLGNKTLFSCTRDASRTPGPGKSTRVQIECSDIEPKAIPSDVQYRVSVSSVEPF